MIAFFRIFYAFKKAFSGNSDQVLGFFTDLAHCVSSGSIRMVAFVNDSCIQADYIALFDNTVS